LVRRRLRAMTAPFFAVPRAVAQGTSAVLSAAFSLLRPCVALDTFSRRLTVSFRTLTRTRRGHKLEQTRRGGPEEPRASPWPSGFRITGAAGLEPATSCSQTLLRDRRPASTDQQQLDHPHPSPRQRPCNRLRPRVAIAWHRRGGNSTRWPPARFAADTAAESSDPPTLSFPSEQQLCRELCPRIGKSDPSEDVSAPPDWAKSIRNSLQIAIYGPKVTGSNPLGRVTKPRTAGLPRGRLVRTAHARPATPRAASVHPGAAESVLSRFPGDGRTGHPGGSPPARLRELRRRSRERHGAPRTGA
jgi:hypothetical protein